MRFELDQRLAEIERLAKELHTNELRHNSLRVEGRVVVWDQPDQIPGVPGPPDLDAETARWVELLDLIDYLEEKVRSFYEIESIDLGQLASALVGGEPDVAAGRDFSANVDGRLAWADRNWLRRVDGMIAEGQWSSPAAQTFHDDFLLPLEDATVEQRGATWELALVAQSYRSAGVGIRRDLDAITHDTIARLHGNPATLAEVFSTAGLIAGAIAFFPPATVVAGAASFAFGVGSVVAAAAQSEPEAPALRVDDGEETTIIRSALREIGKLEELLADHDERLSGALERNLGRSGLFSSPKLAVEQSEVAQNGDGFGELTFIDNPDLQNSPSTVVASLVDIYTAGYVNLPAAAEQYDQARMRLDSCAVPSEWNVFFPRSVPKFHEGRDLLSKALSRTRDAIDVAGQALVDIALGYELEDELTGELMRDVGEVAPPPPHTPTVPDTHRFPFDSPH